MCEKIILRKQFDIVKKLSAFKTILVSGPQRSGTTISGYGISQLLKCNYYTEEQFDFFDFTKFVNLILKDEQKVIQCPTFSYLLDHLTVPCLCVIFMYRDVSEIIKSEKRILWPEEDNEKSKYRSLGNANIIKCDFDSPISVIKYEYWEKYQRQNISSWCEFKFHEINMFFPNLFVNSNDRIKFKPRQIAKNIDFYEDTY